VKIALCVMAFLAVLALVAGCSASWKTADEEISEKGPKVADPPEKGEQGGDTAEK